MTREEAIKELKILKEEYWDDDGYGNETEQYYDTMTALDMAIKALEQEPCDDCISRQAVLDGLARIAKAKAKSDAQKALMGRVMFFTEHLPSVTPEQMLGHMKKFQIDGDVLIDIIDICNALISITDFECCYYNHEEEIKKAMLFVKSYEHFESEDNKHDSNN